MGGLPALERGLSIITRTKCDLPRQHASFEPPTATPLLETSAATGAGLANLAAAIRAAVFDARESDTSVVAATAQRCRASMASATTSLHEARRLVTSPGTEELLAAEIRAALTELGHVSGAVYTDDILDRVFSRFCIGK
jgi:tRNA modification GTPase